MATWNEGASLGNSLPHRVSLASLFIMETMCLAHGQEQRYAVPVLFYGGIESRLENPHPIGLKRTDCRF
jgi:hypothetical protein